jgi:hypothetical protein
MTLCETLWMLWIMLWMSSSSSTGIRRTGVGLWKAVRFRPVAASL